MKYQIVGTDESDTEIIIESLDNLNIATNTFDFVVLLAEFQNDVEPIFPLWKSIELQQVETISLVEVK